MASSASSNSAQRLSLLRRYTMEVIILSLASVVVYLFLAWRSSVADLMAVYKEDHIKAMEALQNNRQVLDRCNSTNETNAVILLDLRQSFREFQSKETKP